MSKTLAFLQDHIEKINHTHDLEFQFDHEEIEEWTEPNNTFQLEWEKLIVFIRDNLSLSNLTLSLNAAIAIPIYEEQQLTETEKGDYRLQAYKKIIEPLRGLGQMGLRRFYVFWACYHSYEAEAEKEVMGQSHEAVDKVPLSRREPSDPHWDFQAEREKEKQENKEVERAPAQPGLVFAVR